MEHRLHLAQAPGAVAARRSPPAASPDFLRSAATDSHTMHFHPLQRGMSDRIRNRRANERMEHSSILL
ncbi:hypothetical protein E6R62_36745 [Streptomyces sp. A1136]|nr:hypothetical protein E6R62_36745 [Streptomyces sp. A1136]